MSMRAGVRSLVMFLIVEFFIVALCFLLIGTPVLTPGIMANSISLTTVTKPRGIDKDNATYVDGNLMNPLVTPTTVIISDGINVFSDPAGNSILTDGVNSGTVNYKSGDYSLVYVAPSGTPHTLNTTYEYSAYINHPLVIVQAAVNSLGITINDLIIGLFTFATFINIVIFFIAFIRR